MLSASSAPAMAVTSRCDRAGGGRAGVNIPLFPVNQNRNGRWLGGRK